MKYICEECGICVGKVRDFNVYAVKSGIRVLCGVCFKKLMFGGKKE